ncbi:Zn-dependent amino-or carboxypeptidase, M28 family [Tenacibaculum sp. 190130A14a]|uniref:Zn-dependent amino-or carboxypeptidase, M28 family n=1 Tax=Tenacibaculum polynesiense TaxID=3137857 RepID=A0ABP1F472_9FLAO
MKKLFIGLGSILLITVVGLTIFPQLLYLFSFTQKWALKMEGEQSALFYFKNNQKDSLYMKGVIYSGTYTDLTQKLNEHPSITTLVMEEVPGSIDDEVNLKVSREIRSNNINTYIPKNGWVASGGTDMFLAGKKRQIAISAKLGVHSWADMEKTATDYPKEDSSHTKYLEYYKEMDIPTDFYWYTLQAAPADGIHWMTPIEINTFKVVTPSLNLNQLLENQKVLASDEYAGRGTGNNLKAQDLIRNHFKKNKLLTFSNNYNHSFSFKNENTHKIDNGTNIIGYIKGKKYPNQYIVIGAHYDHLGIINRTVYNGADDNASGTSALLTLASYFSKNKPNYSIIFAAFDAEELGLWGSRNFVKEPPIPLKQIKINFNFDMISRNPNNEIYVVGTHYYPQFKSGIENIIQYHPELTISFGHDDPNDKQKDYWMESSDNAPFFKNNIPNITFSEEDHPDYHKHTDDIDNTNPEFYKNVVVLIKNTIHVFDSNLLIENND